MDEKTSRYILYTGTVMSLLMLSGCAPWEWVKDKLEMGKKPVPTVTEVPVGVTQDRDDKVLVTMKGVPVMTFIRGTLAFNEGTVTVKPGHGKFQAMGSGDRPTGD